ncbi:hypothetical protein TNCT_219791 [Trichonephila clavata]|uniref:Uncharacterized protein n=1 Tax=Trichonephila clavata TaxID=2740835 RepID=A0A8X6F0U2_TRICU|nr:hypothetical protein TNCT_219791 [Trichonephila clavata]
MMMLLHEGAKFYFQAAAKCYYSFNKHIRKSNFIKCSCADISPQFVFYFIQNVNSSGNALSSILTHRFCSVPQETIHFIQNEIKTNHVGRNGSDACRFPGYDAVSRRQCDF